MRSLGSGRRLQHVVRMRGGTGPIARLTRHLGPLRSHRDTIVIPWPSMAFTLRTDEKLEKALDELAKDEGLSKQEIIRRAVLDRYERAGHAKRVDDSTHRMMDRWGDVLDRLGSV